MTSPFWSSGEHCSASFCYFVVDGCQCIVSCEDVLAPLLCPSLLMFGQGALPCTRTCQCQRKGAVRLRVFRGHHWRRRHGGRRLRRLAWVGVSSISIGLVWRLSLSEICMDGEDISRCSVEAAQASCSMRSRWMRCRSRVTSCHADIPSAPTLMTDCLWCSGVLCTRLL